MIFERVEVKGLAHYSYIVGCEESKKVVVIDPERIIASYLRYAEQRKLTITHVLETHIHADYASGAKELAHRCGASLCLSSYDTGETYEIAFPHQELTDGQILEVGSIRIQVVHTPGHTPEHLSFVVFDSTTKSPQLMLSGDFVFVGSLGRPDLLGDNQKLALATSLFRSVQNKLLSFPDSMQICPAHGAGSLCGAGIGSYASTTLQAERLSNPYLKISNEQQFVERVLAEVPAFPPYYRRMKALNSTGATAVEKLSSLSGLSYQDFLQLYQDNAIVIDLRDYQGFGNGHVPNSFSITLGPSFITWASWVIAADRPILLVGEGPEDAREARLALLRVGLDNVVGYLEGGYSSWVAGGGVTESLPQMFPEQLHAALFQTTGQNNETQVIDVRTDREWSAGHIPQATHIMCGMVRENIGKIKDKTKPLAVICGGGTRSSLAASILKQEGFTTVFNVAGGMSGWARAGLPLEE